MGCDIHAVIERYSELEDIPGDTWKSWENKGEIFIWRDYSLFYFLAGVRYGEVGPISDPKYYLRYGSIGGVSGPTQGLIDLYGRDGHTHSWSSLKELHDNFHLCPERSTWALVKIISKMLAVKQDNDSEEDVRLVFFFDN